MTQSPNERLVQLEAALGRFAELTIANTARDDQAIAQLEANAVRHDENLFRIEGAIADLIAQQQRTDSRFEALSQTQVECLQLIAQNTIEINQIWQYLNRESGNGRSDQI